MTMKISKRGYNLDARGPVSTPRKYATLLPVFIFLLAVDGMFGLEIRTQPHHPRVNDDVTFTCILSNHEQHDSTEQTFLWLFKKRSGNSRSEIVGKGSEHSILRIQLSQEGVYTCFLVGDQGDNAILSQATRNLKLKSNTDDEDVGLLRHKSPRRGDDGDVRVLRHQVPRDVSTSVPITMNLLKTSLLFDLKQRRINDRQMISTTTISEKTPYSKTTQKHLMGFDPIYRYMYLTRNKVDKIFVTGTFVNEHHILNISSNISEGVQTTSDDFEHADKGLYLGIGFAAVGSLAIVAMIIVLIKCDSSKIYICDECNQSLPTIGCLKPPARNHHQNARFAARQSSIDPSTASELQPVEFYLEMKDRKGSTATQDALLYYRRQSSDASGTGRPRAYPDVAYRKQEKGPKLSLLDVQESEEQVV